VPAAGTSSAGGTGGLDGDTISLSATNGTSSSGTGGGFDAAAAGINSGGGGGGGGGALVGVLYRGGGGGGAGATATGGAGAAGGAGGAARPIWSLSVFREDWYAHVQSDRYLRPRRRVTHGRRRPQSGEYLHGARSLRPGHADGRQVELSRQSFTVATKEALTLACRAVLDGLLKQQTDADLAIAVAGKTIAEVKA